MWILQAFVAWKHCTEQRAALSGRACMRLQVVLRLVVCLGFALLCVHGSDGVSLRVPLPCAQGFLAGDTETIKLVAFGACSVRIKLENLHWFSPCVTSLLLYSTCVRV